MRPANLFVAEMTKYNGDVTIVFGESRINGRSIMNIMASCIKCGAEITVECDGADEQAQDAQKENIHPQPHQIVQFILLFV